jgi:processive 1,2-diacylglycerol beta-glucosyltransferase
MKIAILSTATGQGHNAAAMALKERFISMGCEVLLADLLNMGGNSGSKRASKTYETAITKAPHVFRTFYELGWLIDSQVRHSPVYYANATHAEGVLKELNAFTPEAVLCTHMFGAHIMTYLSVKYSYSPFCVGVMTDYTPTPLWAETRCDFYITPSPLLNGSFEKSGLPASKLLPFGIPVAERFRSRLSKAEAKSRFGLNEKPVVAIIGGSMGFGAISSICRALRENLPEVQVVAVCGHNKKAFDAVSAVKGVIPTEFIGNVDELIDATDVLLTKPGGLTTSEAINKAVPLVLTNPIPGCEEANARFLSANGLAIATFSPADAAKAARRLLENAEDCEKMSAAQKLFTQNDACSDICSAVLKKVEDNKQIQMQNV